MFGEAWVENAIVTGRTNNPAGLSGSVQGFQFYDTWVKTILTNVIFRNYPPRASYSSVQDDNRAIISMTHSDVFKPQGISAVRNLKYENFPRSQIIGHRIQDTGASRYYNFVDWDGSASLLGKPAIVGSHMNWWKLDNNCKFETDWNTWVCEKLDREVANIDLFIPGWIVNSVTFDNAVVPSSALYMGKMCLFGGDVAIGEDRCVNITRNPGVTGATGANLNWFMTLARGVPQNFTIQPGQVPFGKSVMFAVNYPSNTNFNITTSYLYNTRYNFKLTRVNTLAEVQNGDGKKYYFDGTYLFVKLVNLLKTNDPSEYFERGGVRIYDIAQGFYYNFVTSCSPDSTGFCAATTTTPPRI